MDVTKLTNRVLECSLFTYTVTTGKQRAGDPYFKLHTGTRVLTQHTHILLTPYNPRGGYTQSLSVQKGHSFHSEDSWGSWRTSVQFGYT
jgi:hypothetical protein